MSAASVSAAAEKALVEDVLRRHGGVFGRARDIDMASRKAEEAAIRRYDAASWLRRTVGVVCAKDLAEEPSEEEFRQRLRNGIVLCNALNNVLPGAVPKVVAVPSDSAVPADGTALCAYQYFENVRNFLVTVEDLGLPTFEVSDLEKGGKGARVVDCVLALKSFSESKRIGRQGSCKYGGIVKPSTSGKYFVRKNSDAFMNKLIRSNSAEAIQYSYSADQNLALDFSLDSIEMTTSDSLNMLVRTIVSDKKPEEIPLIVESLLSKVIQEYERRIANPNNLVKCTRDLEDTQSFSRPATLSEPDRTSTCDQVKMDVLSTKEEVSSTILNGDSVVQQSQPMPETNFDLQQRKIQELKGGYPFCCQVEIEVLFSTLEKYLFIISNAASGYHKVLEENRKLYNQVQDLKGNIRVYCRVRPFLPGQASSSSSVAGMEERTITIITPSKYGKDGCKSFTFNKVFGPVATQEEVFSDMQPLIRSVLDGYNVCIFAYGQTGSGKTYTMSGPKVLTVESLGVNYRALNDLFNLQAQRKGTMSYEISVQMIEIYNEQVRDLLQNSGNKKLEIRNSSQKGLAVPDANIVPVTSTSDVVELMNQGEKNRAVGSTAMNDRSSRSHSCLTVHVQGRDLTSGTILRGCMHLVDLAGSERVDKSEVVGDRLKEAQHINKSLSALGDVISSLAQKNSHVPYRNSKLTQLLQDSLGGQAKTLMFVHISPELDAISETLSTLKFAERVASVELGAAKINKEAGEIRELKEQIACLKAALARKEGEPKNTRSTQSSPDIYRMRKGNATSPLPKNRQPMEEVGNLEARSNVTSMQKKPNFDFSDILFENDSSAWLENCKGTQKETGSGGWVDKVVVNNHQFENGTSFLELGSDATQAPSFFYQRYGPEQHKNRGESVGTEDSDDFDAATSCSSDQEMVWSANAPKAKNFANGRVSTAKKPQVNSAKSTEIRSTNPPRKLAPSQKKPNGPSQTPIKKRKEQTLGGVDGRRTPNGKLSTMK